MSEPAPLLGREGIEEAFRRLGDRLAKRSVVADIYVFGGAAMALAYDSRRAATQTRVICAAKVLGDAGKMRPGQPGRTRALG